MHKTLGLIPKHQESKGKEERLTGQKTQGRRTLASTEQLGKHRGPASLDARWTEKLEARGSSITHGHSCGAWHKAGLLVPSSTAEVRVTYWNKTGRPGHVPRLRIRRYETLGPRKICLSGNWPPIGVCWYLIQCSLMPWLGFLEAASQGQGKSSPFFPEGRPFQGCSGVATVASLSSPRALHITNLCYRQWLNTGSASLSIYLPSAPKCTFKNSYWVVVASMYSVSYSKVRNANVFQSSPWGKTALHSPEFPSGISEPRNSPQLDGPL